MSKSLEYPFEKRPLSEDEGGGWLIAFPDLPGCISDGQTPEEAMVNGKDAVAAWIITTQAAGRELPRPGAATSGRLVTRVPRSIHARLSDRAKEEGVSVNALVSTFLAEGLGRRDSIVSEAQQGIDTTFG
jgi:antitoxin HicB